MNSWQLPLSEAQKKDLDINVLQYIRWCCEARSDSQKLTHEEKQILIDKLSILLDVDLEKSDSISAEKPLTLPRKWNSIVRLQHRIMSLEQHSRDLTEELESLNAQINNNGPQILNKLKININWIPKNYPQCSITLETSISAIKLHPQLPIIFIGTDNGKLYAYDIFNYSLPLDSTQAHIKGITSIDAIMEFKNNNKTEEPSAIIATSSKDLSIKLFRWSAKENKFLLFRVLMNHEHIVSEVKLFRKLNNIYLASCSRDTSIRIWTAEDGMILNSFHPHNEWVRCLDVSGDFVLSGSQDASLRLTHWPSGNGLSIGIGHEFPIESVKFILPLSTNEKASPTINYLRKPLEIDSDYEKMSFKYCASASRDRLIKIWEIPTPRFVMHRPPVPNSSNSNFKCIMTLKGHASWVKDLRIRGNYLFSCSDDKTIRCWNLENGECVKQWTDLHSGFVTCLDMDPDGGTNDTGQQSLQREIMATGGLDSKCNILFR
ncbi:hypothetical protein NCAS_0B00430 [Naumovozyma castellii]|uniref:Nuclear distribution protein PAC1 n=1 Tax=Naumovozyma castellii TaxID=27288 RepID=G0VB04_NAUCA|nr:hypothetical protein NCAS_0B00430 [Naumovozyma castellii CBS 4309]CCC68127.1 hypothetical protein NCAS_0B00430 [Naumovozyma castellii CBS 4309]